MCRGHYPARAAPSIVLDVALLDFARRFHPLTFATLRAGPRRGHRLELAARVGCTYNHTVLAEHGRSFSAQFSLRQDLVDHMTTLKTTKTVFTASQFLDWQRSGVLQLNPIFQRRPVWKAPARSQLIDSVVRGYPIPIVLLRQVQDLNTLKMRMEVVDGQQRLRALIAYLDGSALPDYKADRDAVVVRRTHNKDIAGKPFNKLPADVKQAILSYEFSTHVLPASAGDELVYRIFARLNSTGLSLNHQEIRNAEFHGAFKTLVYELSFQFLESWRRWQIFNNDAIARMEEAEAVSEYLIAMIEGLGGKSQARITRFYKDHDETLASSEVLEDRFTRVMTAIDNSVGKSILGSAFQRPALFFSLWVAFYHHMYRLQSPLRKHWILTPPAGIEAALRRVSERITKGRLPEKVQDAMDRATSDPTRRRIRHRFLIKGLGLRTE